MEENMENIAKHFLVLKATGCHPDVTCSMVIARESCCTINPLRLRRLNDATINNLNVYNVGIASVTGDGAPKNVTFNAISCVLFDLGTLLQRTQGPSSKNTTSKNIWIIKLQK